MNYRVCLLILVSLFLLTAAVSANQAGTDHDVAKILVEVRQFDEKVASLQADREKEKATIEATDSSAEKKQQAYYLADQEYSAKLAWQKHYRQEKAVKALELYALKYSSLQNTAFWSEGNARINSDGKADNSVQAVQQAEQDAINKAALSLAETISPKSDLVLLKHEHIKVAVDKIAADNTDGYGKASLVKLVDSEVYEAKARVQVKPAAVNPYALAAQALRAELEVARLDLLRLYPIMTETNPAWEAKLQLLTQEGRVISERKLDSLQTDTVVNGSELTKPTRSCILLTVILPAGIDGDNSRLEVVIRDKQPKATAKQLLFSLSGIDGDALYEYKSFTPPIISLSAGTTTLQNVRLRVGESIIRLDPVATGNAAIELMNGELTATSNGKLTRRIAYEGRVGQLKAIVIARPESVSMDGFKLYQDGILILSGEVNEEGAIAFKLNAEFPVKR